MTTVDSPSEQERLAAFGTAWERFFRAVRRGRGRFAAEGDGGLTLPQYLLLEPLGVGESHSVRELAVHAGVSAPSATRMLDGLERAGLVERRQSTRDRRCLEVGLTGAGRRALAAARARVEAGRRSIFAALEPGEREAAERLLARLAEVVEGL